jgi:hypothetical protein
MLISGRWTGVGSQGDEAVCLGLFGCRGGGMCVKRRCQEQVDVTQPSSWR